MKKYNKKKCAFCGKEFRAKHWGKKYCSEKCKNENKKLTNAKKNGKLIEVPCKNGERVLFLVKNRFIGRYYNNLPLDDTEHMVRHCEETEVLEIVKYGEKKGRASRIAKNDLEMIARKQGDCKCMN